MTQTLRDEWDRHQSLFARTWLTSMVSKGRVHFAEVAGSNKLRREIERVAATKATDRRAMQKDFHLIEAAIATDRTVISLDERVRVLFSAAAEVVLALSKIVWVNPDKAEEQCILWLENRAKPERKRMLGYRA